MLGALSFFGITVVVLHSLALARATSPLRREMLRLAADINSRQGEPQSDLRLPTDFHVVLHDPGGAVLTGRPLPPRIRRHMAGRPDGEYCLAVAVAAPCYALRRLPSPTGTKTLVIYYRPTSKFFAPLTVAFLASVVLWLAASSAAGLLLLRALRRRDDERRRLLAGLAHDLGTPLTSIRGFAETLLSAPETRGGEQRGWTIVYREALRMQRLVEDMLALSGMEAGKLALVPRPFDLREALAAGAERAALAYGTPPEMKLPETEARIVADRDRIDQILANLIDNAYRHGEGKDVLLSLEPTQTGWRVEVRDGGPGLSTRAREHLFEAYHRGDTAAGGSGLGLAIARELAACHGGNLRLENAPSGGCRAILELPARRAAAR